MRNSPVAGAPPMDPISRPMAQAASPLGRLRPASTATIDRPKSASMNSSAEPNSRISGRAISTKPVRITAPKIPPKSEEMKAADSARAAWPCFASGKPSSTVACDALDPGMPMRTEEKVSEVGMTATRPISMPRAEISSMP